MQSDLSIIHLVLEAGPVVKAVMLLLLLASIASWAVIFSKRRMLRRSRASADRFEKAFWSGGDLTGLYRKVSAREEPATGMEGIFEAGFREFGRLRQQDGHTPGTIVEGCQRAMRVSQMREVDRLEQNLAMLATIGSPRTRALELSSARSRTFSACSDAICCERPCRTRFSCFRRSFSSSNCDRDRTWMSTHSPRRVGRFATQNTG